MFNKTPFSPPILAWAAEEESFGHGHGRHGPHGFGGPRSGGFDFGSNFWAMFGPRGPRGPQMFGRGDLKYMLLELITTQPKHGYEMIKDLEQRAGGFYTPSAGAVYPTLQLLEDRGWVTSQLVDGKKVYTITAEGQAALQERGPRPEPFGGPEHEHGGRGHRHGPRGPFGPRGAFGSPELREIGEQGIEVARLMRAAVMRANGDPTKLAQLRRIVTTTRNALQAFLNNDSGDDVTPTGPTSTV